MMYASIITVLRIFDKTVETQNIFQQIDVVRSVWYNHIIKQ